MVDELASSEPGKILLLWPDRETPLPQASEPQASEWERPRQPWPRWASVQRSGWRRRRGSRADPELPA